MFESGYYPAGSEFDPDAPWNQADVPEKEFDVTISQSLSKDTTVTTNDYIPGASGVDYEPDDEGGYCSCGWQDPDDTSGINWGKVYSEEHLTPLEIIQECKRLAEFCIGAGWQSISNAKVTIKRLIDECSGWTDDETEIVEN